MFDLFLLFPIISIVLAVIFIYIGIKQYSRKNEYKKLEAVLDKVLFFIPRNFKAKLKEVLELNLFSENVVLISQLLIIALIATGIITSFITIRISEVWYVQVLAIVFSMYMPFYLLSLIQGVLIQSINNKIPSIIEEFRITFDETPRTQIALRQTGEEVGGKIGYLLIQTANSSNFSNSLLFLKDRIRNVWFSAFASKVLQHHENGGDLIGQLYGLSLKISTYNNLEKKRNFRVVLYEILLICVVIGTIPFSNLILHLFADESFFNVMTHELSTYTSLFIITSLCALIVLNTIKKG